jgi:Zn-dependent protease with chaperone function
MLNPPLLAVSALFFIALTAVFYVAAYALAASLLRAARGRLSHSFTKRALLGTLAVPPILALALTVGGATLRHVHSPAASEHHSAMCRSLFGTLSDGPAASGTAAVTIGVLANGGAWVLFAAGVVLTARLFRATSRLESGLAPFQSPPSPALAAALGRIAARMPRLPSDRFFECPIPVGYSSVLGFLRPRCVLSREFVAAATPNELDAVVAHEASHMAAGDVPATFLAGALNCLFFYVRPVRLLARRWREETELVCDERAVAVTGQPLVMAAAILRASGHSVTLPPRFSLPAVALPFADDAACSPAVRIERLLEQAQHASLPMNQPESRASIFASWSATFALSGIGIVAMFSQQALCFAHCSLEAVARLLP